MFGDMDFGERFLAEQKGVTLQQKGLSRVSRVMENQEKQWNFTISLSRPGKVMEFV